MFDHAVNKAVHEFKVLKTEVHLHNTASDFKQHRSTSSECSPALLSSCHKYTPAATEYNSTSDFNSSQEGSFSRVEHNRFSDLPPLFAPNTTVQRPRSHSGQSSPRRNSPCRGDEEDRRGQAGWVTYQQYELLHPETALEVRGPRTSVFTEHL